MPRIKNDIRKVERDAKKRVKAIGSKIAKFFGGL
jgi:hypothetical protein